jgi:hypothetical protein
VTIAFALELKRTLKCSQCSDRALPERRFCRVHLDYAKARWDEHVRLCKRLGRCINCHRPKLPNELRCRTCKQHNRDRSKLWWRGSGGARRRAKIQAARNAGICDSCIRRAAIQGHRRCGVCHPGGYAT